MPVLLRTLLLVAALAGGALGQIAQPTDQVLVLAPGKSGTIKVTAPCPVLFDAKTTTPALLEFKPGPESPAKSRSWKVKIKPNVPLGVAGNLRIDLEPTVPDCSPTASLLFTLVVAADAKEITRRFTRGDKKSSPQITGLRGHLKDLRDDLNKIVAAHAFGAQLIQGQLKDGDVVLPPFVPPMPGDPESDDANPLGLALGALTESERALAALGQLEFFVLDRAENVYFDALQAAATEGGQLLLVGGYQNQAAAAAPPAFRPGAGDAWDDFVEDAVALVERAVSRIAARGAAAHRAVEKRSSQRGEPLFVQATAPLLPPLGDGGSSPMGGPLPDPTRNMGMELLSITAWNGPTNGGFDTSNGRILVVGRVNADNVIYALQRLDFFGASVGPLEGAIVPVDGDTNHFLGLFPPANEPGSLQAGTWRVTIQAEGFDPVFAQPLVPIR